MLKSKKLKRVLSIIMTSVFCMVAFSQTLYAEEPEYALKGTIDSALEIMDGTTEWTSSVNTGRIEIDLQSDSDDGAIFTAYKLLNITNDGGVLKVTIPSDAQDFWNTYTEKASATVDDIKDKINSIAGDAAKSSSIVDAFVSFGTKPAEINSTTVNTGKANITTDFGFYAILQTGAPVNGYIASAPMLACLPMQDPTTDKWLSTFTIVPKDDTISITKQVKATGDANLLDETITNIGDTVTYEIIAELPEYGTDIVNAGITYTLTDTLPDGVTIDDATLKVQIEKKGEAIFADTTYASASYDDVTRKITLTVNDYKNDINKVYDKIKITYNAVLNKDAVIESTGNTNTATLTYSSKVGANETATADAKVYTLGLDVTKIDKNGGAALAGAEFEVYTNSAGTGDPIQFVAVTDPDGIQRYRIATQAEIDDVGVTKTTKITVTDSGTYKGMLKLDGLNDTTYYLKETKAPTGYNIPKDLFEIEVKPDNTNDYNAEGALQFDINRLLKKIENSTGIDLPVTGGIGTIIFTVIGLLLMAGAAYFLFFSKKKNAE